mgnify:CR=1 FL=1
MEDVLHLFVCVKPNAKHSRVEAARHRVVADSLDCHERSATLDANNVSDVEATAHDLPQLVVRKIALVVAVEQSGDVLGLEIHEVADRLMGSLHFRAAIFL